MSTWPQWFFAIYLGGTFVYNVYGDGKKQDGAGLLATCLVFPLLAYVLYSGGFWSSWGLTP